MSEISTDNGEAIFSPIKVFAQPNTEVFFKAQTSSVSRYYNEFFDGNNNFSDYNFNGNYMYLFSMVFRDCVIGEVFIEQINRFLRVLIKFNTRFLAVVNVLQVVLAFQILMMFQHNANLVLNMHIVQED